MNLEDFKAQNNPSKIVKAKLTSFNKDKPFEFLSCPDIKSIFLLKKLLISKGISATTLSIGDEFEVEISQGEKGYKVDVIISYKPIEKKEVAKNDTSNKNSEFPYIRNFYSFLHKQKRFDNSFQMYKINVLGQEEYLDKKGNTQYKDIDILKKFENLKGWQPKTDFENFALRHKINAEFLTDNQLKTQTFKPDWRLAIGLGSGSVFETSISLHYVYGFPYIPASAIKGITHHYALSEAKTDKDLEAIKTLFGTAYNTSYEFKEKNLVNPEILSDKNEQGSIIFFDAYPIESPQGKIKADIMNNHYDKWYNEGKPPADYYNPNPIIFLTVECLTFQFMVGLRKGVKNQEKFWNTEKDMLTVVSDLLKDALMERGIGAKTAVGYGYMQ